MFQNSPTDIIFIKDFFLQQTKKLAFWLREDMYVVYPQQLLLEMQSLNERLPVFQAFYPESSVLRTLIRGHCLKVDFYSSHLFNKHQKLFNFFQLSWMGSNPLKKHLYAGGPKPLQTPKGATPLARAISHSGHCCNLRSKNDQSVH